jgi:hypothetical protein
MSHIPPPPGFLKEGEDLDALLQAFTLVPSSQMHASIRKLRKPLKESILHLIADDSHHALASRRQRGDNMVLFFLDRGFVSSYDLRSMIGNDGRERNLHWNLRNIDDLTKSKSFPNEENIREGDADQGTEPRQRMKTRQPSTFILFFKDNQEARRFVRTWHRTPLPVLQEPDISDQEPPIVNAELLW